MSCFTIDLTYGFQEHGIVIAEDPNNIGSDLDCISPEGGERSPQKNCVCGVCHKECRFFQQCAKQRDISWAGLTWRRVHEVFPKELKFDEVIGSHSGQCSPDQFFESLDFTNYMAAYGRSYKAALCVKRDKWDEDAAISWCSMELIYNLDREDILCMQKMAGLLEECLQRPAFLCTNTQHPHLIPLSEPEELAKFLTR